MPSADHFVSTDIDAYLAQHQNKALLRFITCGSVDDGKSTLIGRLLYDSKMIFEDQMATLEADSKVIGGQGANIDFALLVDGLAAEREQGITIDVAYRFFSTEKRKFIVADTPGHEQYTRNMVTGASTADLAVILVDARKGVLTQTRRHAYLVSLMGIRHVVLAINKMDLVGWSQEALDTIESEFADFAAQIGLQNFHAIPVSARDGDNIAARSNAAPWYKGPSLLDVLEFVEIDETRRASGPFRMPVQLVNRPNADFRGVCGLITGGRVKPGDRVRVSPSGRMSSIARIVTKGGDLPEALAGQSVTLTFNDEIDCSRGDVISAADAPAECADQFETTIIWMSDEPLLPGRSYLLKIAAKTVIATITDIKYKININTLERLASKVLELNEIAVCNISLDQPIAFDPFAANPDTGGFILIDRMSNGTAGAGLITFSLRRAQNVHWQAFDVTRESRAEQKRQRAAVLWFTGLSGAGKSTIANLVDKHLNALGHHTVLLDGDNIRHGLNRDLGFTDADRVENIRRVAEVSRLMADAGLIVLVSFISPFQAERRLARDMMKPGEFFEVFVDMPLGEAEERDVKGLYRKARAGELKNFTGVDSPYERPTAPEIHIETTKTDAAAAAEMIVKTLRARE